MDEGVPIDVGKTFEEHGHTVIYHSEVIQPGSSDDLVCTVSLANDAILVACDNDMRSVAKKYGVSNERFKRLSVIKLSCPEPMASKRLAFAMSLIEHEWLVSEEKVARRMCVEIATQTMKSWR